jgi:hypothetical protein
VSLQHSSNPVDSLPFLPYQIKLQNLTPQK